MTMMQGDLFVFDAASPVPARRAPVVQDVTELARSRHPEAAGRLMAAVARVTHEAQTVILRARVAGREAPEIAAFVPLSDPAFRGFMGLYNRALPPHELTVVGPVWQDFGRWAKSTGFAASLELVKRTGGAQQGGLNIRVVPLAK
jgi:hypothetical protein